MSPSSRVADVAPSTVRFPALRRSDFSFENASSMFQHNALQVRVGWPDLGLIWATAS
jgi:hypothetical protein